MNIQKEICKDHNFLFKQETFDHYNEKFYDFECTECQLKISYSCITKFYYKMDNFNSDITCNAVKIINNNVLNCKEQIIKNIIE